jgi:hypothetical protein
VPAEVTPFSAKDAQSVSKFSTRLKTKENKTPKPNKRIDENRDHRRTRLIYQNQKNRYYI